MAAEDILLKDLTNFFLHHSEKKFFELREQFKVSLHSTV